MDRSERKGWLVVAMAIVAIACMMWPMVDRTGRTPRPRRSGVNYCPAGRSNVSRNFAPLAGDTLGLAPVPRLL